MLELDLRLNIDFEQTSSNDHVHFVTLYTQKVASINRWAFKIFLKSSKYLWVKKFISTALQIQTHNKMTPFWNGILLIQGNLPRVILMYNKQ